jgi:UDP-2-acetamido-2,6-beta-L-arabino-hexul-4-ose reductase
MMKVLITGGRGFIGSNLAVALRERNKHEIFVFDQQNSNADLLSWLNQADAVVHLAGVNRPPDPSQFEQGNVGLTELICDVLRRNSRRPKILFSSSIQVDLDNPYGRSKAKAEAVLREFGRETGASVSVFRFKNLFGKWCRPNYNSVTATFCHNIARDLPISISDPAHSLELCYIDNVVNRIITELDSPGASPEIICDIPAFRIQLGELAGRIQAFHDMRHTLRLPDFSDPFNRALYATYLSNLPVQSLEYSLEQRSDSRGSLAEFLKQDCFGQLFISRTGPGITRGNHYHHTKTEKFMVVEGDGIIRMRPITGGSVTEYSVSGHSYQVVDIPPGNTHCITNVGSSDMVTLFWSSEIFDPDRPDTCYLPVLEEPVAVARNQA